MRKVSNVKAAMTYARALYDGATVVGSLQNAYEDCSKFKQIPVDELKSLTQLDNPLWENAVKDDILQTIAAKLHCCEATLNLLKLLAHQNKLFLLLQITEQFILLYQRKQNIAEVSVTSVTPLTDEQQNRLTNVLSNIFHKKVIIDYIFDPQIIGGLVVRYDTYLIDASVRNKLYSLEQFMKGTE